MPGLLVAGLGAIVSEGLLLPPHGMGKLSDDLLHPHLEMPREHLQGEARQIELQQFGGVVVLPCFWNNLELGGYLNNLNTHPFYEEFRKERARQRAGRLSGSISGMKLIEHVHKYSIRGNDYVLGLKKIIEQNALQDFDKANLLVKKSGSI